MNLLQRMIMDEQNITLSKEQVNYILEFDRTHSITTACNLAHSLVEMVLKNEIKDVENV